MHLIFWLAEVGLALGRLSPLALPVLLACHGAAIWFQTAFAFKIANADNSFCQTTMLVSDKLGLIQGCQC